MVDRVYVVYNHFLRRAKWDIKFECFSFTNKQRKNVISVLRSSRISEGVLENKNNICPISYYLQLKRSVRVDR